MALVVLSCSKDSDGSSEPETLREYMESNSFFVQRIGVIEDGRIPAEDVKGLLSTHLITFDFSLPDAIRTLKTFQYNLENYDGVDGCYFDGGSYSLGEWSELDFGITRVKVSFGVYNSLKFIIEKDEDGNLVVGYDYDGKIQGGFAFLTNERAWMDEYGLNYCLD